MISPKPFAPPPEPSVAGVRAGGSEDPKPLLVRGGDALRALISRTPRCRLRPTAFFVSWQGVITLAYRWHPTLKPYRAFFPGRASSCLRTGAACWKPCRANNPAGPLHVLAGRHYARVQAAPC